MQSSSFPTLRASMESIVPPSHSIFFDKKNTPWDIIVFSHLRWEFVTQRPQHLLARLAKERKVLFVEEPIPYTSTSHGKAKLIKVTESITVLQPCIDPQALVSELIPIVQRYASRLTLQSPILWFYSPMFVDVIDALDHSGVVYDCMDELSQFLGAPAELVEKEKVLLRVADVVFTGGKSLYESKKQLAQNVYCFPSSVDRKHFEQAFRTSTRIPQDIQAIEQPIVGFYGVIDERLDLGLIDCVAAKLPSVSFVFLGPVVKIRQEDLPQRDNLYFFGARKYTALPQYLKAFSIAWMPFALNRHTRFISPTKTLEYMAARKPIVSTAIFDVVRDYEHEVFIVDGVHSCVRAIVAALRETSVQRKAREALQEAVIDRTSWDKTAAAMQDCITQIVAPATKQKQTVLPFGVSYERA